MTKTSLVHRLVQAKSLKMAWKCFWKRRNCYKMVYYTCI